MQGGFSDIDGGGVMEWQPIETAPKDGRRIRGQDADGRLHETFWGKTSHVPLYGWNYGDDVEDLNLWEPTHWMPLPEPPE